MSHDNEFDDLKKYEKIGRDLLRVVKFVPFTEVIQRGIDELDATDPKTVISYGYDWLDDKMTGIFPGELTIIGGESGTGKTTFATNIVYKASALHKCAVFALEDRLVDYGIKALYFEIGRLRKRDGLKNYPWNAYRKNEIEDAFYLNYRKQAQANLKNGNVLFAEVTEMMDIDLLERAIEEQVKDGVKLLLIDHLHYFDLMKGDGNKSDYVEQVMIRIKRLLDKHAVPALMVVHYKKLEGRKPSIDSFKDSIAIVQNANYVVNLWRDRTMKDDASEDRFDTKVFVPKSRNPNGEFTVEVRFNPDTNDFDDPFTFSGTPIETNSAGAEKAQDTGV